MIDVLRRWFARAEIRLQPRPRLEPRAVSGREVAFVDGYSLLELERAGLTEDQALAAGLAIDRERTSSLGCNVLQLEKLLSYKGKQESSH